MKKIFVLCVLALAAACGDLDSERARTEKLLGVKVKDLPADAEFVEADSNAPIFKAYIRLKGDSAVEFDPSLGQRSSVYATAPDGTVWEAYCGKAGSLPVVSPEMDFRPNQLTLKTFVEPYKGFESTPANTRQNYGTHHGYSFSPLDVFIGRNEAGKLSTKLFFRDVGSHTTAPHHMAID